MVAHVELLLWVSTALKLPSTLYLHFSNILYMMLVPIRSLVTYNVRHGVSLAWCRFIACSKRFQVCVSLVLTFGIRPRVPLLQGYSDIYIDGCASATLAVQ